MSVDAYITIMHLSGDSQGDKNIHYVSIHEHAEVFIK